MSTFARIIDDIAVDVCRVSPDQAFCEALALQFVAVPDEVVPGSRRSLDEFGDVIWTAPVVVAPVPPPPPYYGRIITRLAFLKRFTDAEAVAIDLASIGNTVQAAMLRRAQAKISAAEEIQLDNTETRDGVLALETAGLLATGRAVEILDAAVLATEVPARYRAVYALPEVPA